MPHGQSGSQIPGQAKDSPLKVSKTESIVIDTGGIDKGPVEDEGVVQGQDQLKRIPSIPKVVQASTVITKPSDRSQPPKSIPEVREPPLSDAPESNHGDQNLDP